MAALAVAHRIDAATSRAMLRVAVPRVAEEALAARAIRETRNLENLAAEILERDASR